MYTELERATHTHTHRVRGERDRDREDREIERERSDGVKQGVENEGEKDNKSKGRKETDKQNCTKESERAAQLKERSWVELDSLHGPKKWRNGGIDVGKGEPGRKEGKEEKDGKRERERER